jgi:hypothetical protein
MTRGRVSGRVSHPKPLPPGESMAGTARVMALRNLSRLIGGTSVEFRHVG